MAGTSTPHFQAQRLTVLIAGGVLLAGSLSLLWWNEGRAVEADLALGDAPSTVVNVDAAQIEPVYEGRLVHVSGEAQAVQPLQDTDLDLVFDNALVIERRVEMYQWMELPGQAYRLGWSAQWHDASKFRVAQGHVNREMQLTSQRWTAGDASLGAFALPEEALSQIAAPTAIKPSGVPPGWTEFGDHFYLALNAARPSPGDIRVRYFVVRAPSLLSVIAQQRPGGFGTYRMSNGTGLFLVSAGAASASDMLDAQAPGAMLLVWALRACGLAALWLGVFLIIGKMKILSADGAVRLAALAASLPLGLGTISLAWLFQRPVTAASLLLLGACCCYALVRSTHLFHEPQALAA